MPLPDPTYIVLDMPTVLTDFVMDLRMRFSKRLLCFPVEITVAGSSGVGPLESSQELAQVCRVVSDISSQVDELSLSFPRILTFPGTGVYFFEPTPRASLEDIHTRILASGLRFASSPFPFTPHLTALKVNPSNQAMVSEVEALRPPIGAFRVLTCSVYSIGRSGCELRHRVGLTGGCSVAYTATKSS